jgi:hypothetical protein
MLLKHRNKQAVRSCWLEIIFLDEDLICIKFVDFVINAIVGFLKK